jgi:hypothetical protein
VAAGCRSAAAEVEEGQMAVEEVVEDYQHHHNSETMGQVLQVLVGGLVEELQRRSQVQHKSSCQEEQLPGVHWCRNRPRSCRIHMTRRLGELGLVHPKGPPKEHCSHLGFQLGDKHHHHLKPMAQERWNHQRDHRDHHHHR